jgi:hypothetical protein
MYRDMLAGGRGGGADAVLSFAELTELCRTLHQINFLASTYVAAQQRSFGSKGPATAPPSRAERLRVLRAFYRRQIVCNAWAPTRREPRWMDQDAAAISNTSDHQGVRLGLFAASEPWELQQVTTPTTSSRSCARRSASPEKRLLRLRRPRTGWPRWWPSRSARPSSAIFSRT